MLTDPDPSLCEDARAELAKLDRDTRTGLSQALGTIVNKKLEETIRPWFSRGSHDWADVEVYAAEMRDGVLVLHFIADHYNYNFAQSGSDWADHYVFAGEAHLVGGKRKRETFALEQHIHLSEHESEGYDRRKIIDTVRAEKRAKLRGGTPGNAALEKGAAEEPLEQDPVTLPRWSRCLRSDLAQLAGVWGSAGGLVAATRWTSVWGLAFLPSKSWLVITSVMEHGGGAGDWIRAVAVPSGFEVPTPCVSGDVAAMGRLRGCWSLDVDESDRLLAAMSDMTIRLVDGATGAELRTFKLGTQIVRFVGSRHFAVARTGFGGNLSPFSCAGFAPGPASVAIHELSSGARVAEAPLGGSMLLGISSDAAGDRIALALRGQTGSVLRMIDRDGAVLWETKLPRSVAESSSPIDLSRDGKVLAVAGGGSLSVYDANTGELVRVLKESRGYSSVKFSRDGRRLAYAVDSKVGICSPSGPTVGESKQVGGDLFAWSPDGSLVAACTRNGRISVFKADDVSLLAAEPGYDLGFGLDAERVVLGRAADRTFLVANHQGVVARRIPRAADDGLRVLGLAGDGRIVAQKRHGKTFLFLVDESGTVPLYDGPDDRGAMVSTACSPARLIATGIASATVVDLGSGAKTELRGAHTEYYVFEGDYEDHEVIAAAVSPDVRFAATSSSDATLAIWSLPAGKVLHHFEVLAYEQVRSPAHALAFSRDSNLLLAVVTKNFGSAEARAYDVKTCQIRYQVGGEADMRVCAIAPAVAVDRRLVAFAIQDGVLLCHPDDGRVLDRLNIGDEPVALAFAEPNLFVQTSRGQLLRFRLDSRALDAGEQVARVAVPPPEKESDST